MQLFDRFPCVVTFQIALPFKKILKSFVSPKVPMFPYCFHFIFVFALDKVRWRAREVGAMRVRFNVWGKKASVENRVYVPLGREFQMIGNG